jgi:hypothetical protein
MTVGQRLKVLWGAIAVLILSGIGLVISIAIGPSLLQAFREGLILGIAATLFFLMCLLMGVGCAIAAGADLLDVALGRSRSADGPINVHTEKLSTNALARPFPSSYSYPRQFTYHLEVADHGFTIGKPLFEALSGKGSLRVYYAAYSGELLSLELQEPSQAG